MRVLIGVAHPKQVHMFKNFTSEMVTRGHQIVIVAITKDVMEFLLKQFHLPHIIIGKNSPSVVGKLLNMPKWEYLTLKAAIEFRPDIFVGRVLPNLAHVSAVLRKPYVAFIDTEHASIENRFSLPFADAIVTPRCYMANMGKKHVRFDGYYELAYLHPNYFKPNPAVLDEVGLREGETFIILRFVSWTAIHDIGHHGIDNKMEWVQALEKYGRLFISSQTVLPEELERYRLKVSPDKLHDLLYYASLCVSDGAAVPVESAVLGTPAIYVSSLAGKMGNLNELEQKYGLLFSYSDYADAINKAVELMQKPDLKERWREKRQRLLEENIDVTDFMVSFVERYGEGTRR
ncbi:MAG: DUF354 domain-containing protein [Chloroflexi bacterium]|nr:DUF354 domain-containing protein [Chloroflexota bacterium]